LAWYARADEVSEITDAVPIPLSGRRSKYPLDQLAVGDSFTCPSIRRASIRTCICMVRKEYPERKFTVRHESLDRIRIWRTS